MSEETIAAILAALLPLAFTALFTWIERRGQEARRNTAIDTAYRRVQFLQLYLTTQQLILSPEQYEMLKQTIGLEVRHIFAELTTILNDTEKASREANQRNVVQRAFLLYRMHSTQGNIFRALFYILFGISTIISLLFTIGTATNQNTSIITAIVGIAIILLPFLSLALLFRWLALRHERNAGESLHPMSKEGLR